VNIAQYPITQYQYRSNPSLLSVYIREDIESVENAEIVGALRVNIQTVEA